MWPIFLVSWSQYKVLHLDPVLMLFPRDTIHKVVDRLRSTHADTVALKFVPSGPMRGSRGQNHRAVAEMNEVNKTTRINNFCSFYFDCELMWQ